MPCPAHSRCDLRGTSNIGGHAAWVSEPRDSEDEGGHFLHSSTDPAATVCTESLTWTSNSGCSCPCYISVGPGHPGVSREAPWGRGVPSRAQTGWSGEATPCQNRHSEGRQGACPGQELRLSKGPRPSTQPRAPWRHATCTCRHETSSQGLNLHRNSITGYDELLVPDISKPAMSKRKRAGVTHKRGSAHGLCRCVLGLGSTSLSCTSMAPHY